MPVYTNAADVLPPELFAEVQKRWHGLLYVPAPKIDTPERRDADALAAIRSGCPAKAVADVFGIPLWRVYRIANSLGKLNPYRHFKKSDGKSDG